MRGLGLSLALLAGLSFVVACSKESVPGGPGANASSDAQATAPADHNATPSAGPAAPDMRDTSARDNTFTLKVPALTTKIERGAAAEVDLRLSRGSAFKQVVKLEFKAPEGLKIDPADVAFAGDQDSLKISVTADDNTPEGEHQIEVTATPESGKAVKEIFAVNVKPRS